MANQTHARQRNGQGTQNPTVDNSSLSKGLLLLMAATTVYGEGKPKYKLLNEFHVADVINGVDNAYESTSEARQDTKVGQGAVMVSVFEGREVLSLGVNVGKGMVFAGLMHDSKGAIVAKKLTLIEVEAIEDISYNDEVVVEKGRKLIKAVTAEYLARIRG